MPSFVPARNLRYKVAKYRKIGSAPKRPRTYIQYTLYWIYSPVYTNYILPRPKVWSICPTTSRFQDARLLKIKFRKKKEKKKEKKKNKKKNIAKNETEHLAVRSNLYTPRT